MRSRSPRSAEDRVRAVLYLNGLRGEDLDDALQEVRTKTLERPPRDVDAVGRWQAVVAVRVAMDHHRRRARELATIERMYAAGPAGVTGDRDVVLREVIARGLAELDPDWRAVVVLRFYEDRSLEQIADDLQLPLGTVKSRLHRAVKQLREALPREEVRT
jgi:RNA polymerase sigma-70 factor (ECF subfamily)